jgi:hypothetical protein
LLRFDFCNFIGIDVQNTTLQKQLRDMTQHAESLTLALTTAQTTIGSLRAARKNTSHPPHPKSTASASTQAAVRPMADSCSQTDALAGEIYYLFLYLQPIAILGTFLSTEDATEHATLLDAAEMRAAEAEAHQSKLQARLTRLETQLSTAQVC